MVWSPDRASISVWCRPQRLTPRSEIKSAHASPHRTWSPSPAGPSHLLPRTDRFLLLTTGGLISVWCRPQRLTPRSEIKSAHASPHRTWSPSPAGPSHLLPRTDRFLLLTTGGLIRLRHPHSRNQGAVLSAPQNRSTQTRKSCSWKSTATEYPTKPGRQRA